MHIAIVGGGTAGWIAALFLARSQPSVHKVTVVESSKIGIIGAGEGSTGLLLDLLQNKWFDTGIDLKDFVDSVDGTIKLGIRHKNWTGDGSDYYAPLDGSNTSQQNPDLDFLDIFANYGVNKMHVASNIGRHFEAHEFPDYYALHFDGHKIGKYLKSHLADTVEAIDSVVKNIELSESTGNIDYIVLDDDSQIKADLYIDCTGFSRVFSKKLGVSWESYSKHLPVNRAMPFLVDYKDGEVPEPLTTAHALSSGWMWNIPLQTRRGCGYVYDKNFISDEDAKKEVEKLLGHEITPIKFIDFESGRSEVLWKNNCVFLGLSAAFAEPLEATSIHTTIVQMLVFCFEFLNSDEEKTFTENNVERYNKRMSKMYDDIRDFLVMHYQGGRQDSPFWNQFIKTDMNTEFSREILNKSAYKVPGIFQFDYYFGCIGAPLWNWVLAGLGKITPELAKKELELYGYKK
jgi:tryptophan 6-halogenase